MKIVPLHNGKPPLTDIPGRLRALADNIEAGVNGDVASVIVLLPRSGDYPTVLQYGDVETPNDPMVQLQLALHWFCQNLVIRK